MAFTIPNPIQNSENPCGLEERTYESRDPVTFHRHCQKTVLSAYGIQPQDSPSTDPDEGEGLTWSTIRELQLSNLPNFNDNLRQGWIYYFTNNHNNITQDLASILQIIDKVAEQMQRPFYLQFKDFKGNTIGQTTKIDPWTDSNSGSCPTYEFGGFGKTITLNLNGQTLVSFDTVGGDNTGTFSLAIPQGRVKFQRNGQDFGDTIAMYSPDTNEHVIDISDDQNRIGTYTWSDYVSGSTVTCNVEPKYHIYKLGHNQNFSVQFDLSQYSSNSEDVIEWELHIYNYGSAAISINSFSLRNRTNWATINLTDQFYIESQKVNVYVFRADPKMGLNGTLVTSLAYIM